MLIPGESLYLSFALDFKYTLTSFKITLEHFIWILTNATKEVTIRKRSSLTSRHFLTLTQKSGVGSKPNLPT